MMEKVDQDQVHRAEVQVENQEIMLGRSLKITKVESQKSSGENLKNAREECQNYLGGVSKMLGSNSQKCR